MWIGFLMARLKLEFYHNYAYCLLVIEVKKESKYDTMLYMYVIYHNVITLTEY